MVETPAPTTELEQTPNRFEKKDTLLRILFALYAIVFALVIFNIIVVTAPKVYKKYSPINEGFSVLALQTKKIDKKHLVYGFLPYWRLHKAEFLQLDKITDIAYFGLSVGATGEIVKLDGDGNIHPGYNNWRNSEDLNKLIARAKDSGTRVAVTVLSHDDEISDKFLYCESCWEIMITELIAELEYKGIKDVNFDFEYAGYTEEATANQYTKLVDLTNKRLDAHFGDSFVAVSTFADSVKRPRVTKVEELAIVADAIFMMAYDFHRPTSATAGPVAPIENKDTESTYDINAMLKDYLTTIPPSKLILGVPYYGYNWVVAENKPYAERLEGNDIIGYSTSQPYENIMDTILEVKPDVLWDEAAKVPYFSYISPETGSLRMVYFENTQSLKTKYQLAKDNDLAGVGIWALGYDGGYQELWDLLNQEF